MPVPTLISQLSTTASLNSPDGAVDVPSSIDDYQRAHAAFIAQLYAGTVAAPTVIVPSATTTDIGAAASENVDISGNTTITGFGTVAEGINRKGRFTGVLTLTHNATSLILPGNANITTAANDRYEARSLGGGNWIVTKYQYASGLVQSVNIQNQTVTAFTTGGTSTAFTLTPTPASAANTTNQRFRVNFNAAAGTTPTLAVSGQAALALKYRDSTGAKQAITATQVPIGWASDVVNDGTDWVVENVAILPGVTTNSDASTGYVGEYQTAQRLSAAAISLTTATPATVTNLSLTAGDWDVWGKVGFITATGSTSVTRVIAETSTGTSYSGADGAGVAALVYPGGAALNSGGNGSVTINTGVRRFSLAATTQVNLLTQSEFTVAGLSAFGSIHARRVR